MWTAIGVILGTVALIFIVAKIGAKYGELTKESEHDEKDERIREEVEKRADAADASLADDRDRLLPNGLPHDVRIGGDD